MAVMTSTENIPHQPELQESCSRLGNCNSAVDSVWKRLMPGRPFIGEDDVVGPQLFAERLQKDDIRISIDATVLEQNIRSPYVTNSLQSFHVLSEYLYTTDTVLPA